MTHTHTHAEPKGKARRASQDVLNRLGAFMRVAPSPSGGRLHKEVLSNPLGGPSCGVETGEELYGSSCALLYWVVRGMRGFGYRSTPVYYFSMGICMSFCNGALTAPAG